MSYDLDGMTLHVGDVRDVLRSLADESVHAVVTSPPYWALRSYDVDPVVWPRDAADACSGYGHRWGDEQVVEQPTNHNEGFNERWGQGAGARKQETARPRSYSQGRFCQRCGAWEGHYGLEPTPDLYVEHTVQIFREVRRVLRPDGLLWLNIGDCYTSGDRKWRHPGSTAQRNGVPLAGLDESGSRPGTPAGLKPKDLVMIPARVALALQADGWWLRSDIIWSKPNAMPESVEDRPTSPREHVLLLARSERYFYDVEAAKVPSADPVGGRQRAALAGGTAPRGGQRQGSLKTGLERSEDEDRRVGRAAVWTEATPYHPPDRRMRSVWSIPTAQYPYVHFATYPAELVEPCVRLSTSERGVCPLCAAPWARIIERGEPELAAWSLNGAGNYELDAEGWVERSLEDGSMLKHNVPVKTVGWEPTCRCETVEVEAPHGLRPDGPPDPVPATVLDPFAGSGTTLAVARRLGRTAVGIELSDAYAAAAVEHRLTRWWRDPPRPARPDGAQLALEGVG